jgi:hypothetical protein
MPLDLRNLLCGISPLSDTFKNNIRRYNSAFAFTSLGANIVQEITRASGPYCFKISGELHHLAGSLIPEDGRPVVYAQIYIHDQMEQLRLRQNNNGTHTNPTIMTNLQAMLHDTHPYVLLYKQAFQIMSEKPEDEQQNIHVKLRADRDPRRYNLPEADEIAAIIPGQ